MKLDDKNELNASEEIMSSELTKPTWDAKLYLSQSKRNEIKQNLCQVKPKRAKSSLKQS